MQRRHFLLISSIAASSGTFGNAMAAIPTTTTATAATAAWRKYEITTQIDLSEKTGQSRVWIPVPAEKLDGYQRTLGVSFSAPGATKAELFAVPGSDVRMIAVQWADANAPHRVEVTSQIAVLDRSVDLGANGTARKLPASALREYLQPTSLAPLDGIVKTTADKIQAEAGNPKDAVAKARAI